MAGLIASTMVGASVARADSTDELLDQLLGKHILTKAEWQKLKARHAAEAKAAPAPGPGAPAGGNGRYVTALDKGIGVHIPGITTVTKDNGVVTVGDVDIKISGDLTLYGAEEFKSQFSGTAGTPIAPGAPFGAGLGNYGVLGGLLSGTSSTNNAYATRGGYLPSSLVVNIATNQLGYNLTFTMGLYTGGNNINPGSILNANSGGTPVGIGTPGIDLRQVYGTFGTPQIGTFLLGRNLGLFGTDALLNDFTVLGGIGLNNDNRHPDNTSIGRIGDGYIWADWLPQITYTTPNYNGFTASVSLAAPLEAIDTTGSAFPEFGPIATPGFNAPANQNGVAALGPIATSSGTLTGQDQPFFQGQIKYVGQVFPDVKLTAVVNGITQNHRVELGDIVGLAPGASVRSSGVDGFARVDWGAFSAAGYYYWGSAIGQTGFFFGSISPNGQARINNGFYAEAEYTFFERLTLGASYGESTLEANSFDFTQSYVPYLLKSNQSYVGLIKYKLTDWMSINVDFTHGLSINQSGGEIQSNSVTAGTSWFF